MPLRNFWRNTEWLSRAGRTAPAVLLAVMLAGCGAGTPGGTDGAGGGTLPADGMPPAGAPLAYPVTVSGVSSGGYMAVQAHVALAERVGGAAVIAGGPYHCAQGNLGKALSACLVGDAIVVEDLVTFARQASAAGLIADVAELRDDRVWLFHSPADAVVGAAVSEAAADFYRALVGGGGGDRARPVDSGEAGSVAASAPVVLVDDVTAAHGWPTQDHGLPCEEMGGDFINDCDYDAAGALLTHLYGPLAPPVAATGPVQAVVVGDMLPAGSSLGEEAYLFVPPDCADDGSRTCRLHISFHGCQQGAQFLADRFANHVGLNEWAAANRIVVLYPQVEKSLGNPQGCWDWWGYSGKAYDTREGRQIAAVSAMIDAFAEGRLTKAVAPALQSATAGARVREVPVDSR